MADIAYMVVNNDPDHEDYDVEAAYSDVSLAEAHAKREGMYVLAHYLDGSGDASPLVYCARFETDGDPSIHSWPSFRVPEGSFYIGTVGQGARMTPILGPRGAFYARTEQEARVGLTRGLEDFAASDDYKMQMAAIKARPVVVTLAPSTGPTYPEGKPQTAYRCALCSAKVDLVACRAPETRPCGHNDAAVLEA